MSEAVLIRLPPSTKNGAKREHHWAPYNEHMFQYECTHCSWRAMWAEECNQYYFFSSAGFTSGTALPACVSNMEEFSEYLGIR